MTLIKIGNFKLDGGFLILMIFDLTFVTGDRDFERTLPFSWHPNTGSIIIKASVSLRIQDRPYIMVLGYEISRQIDVW